MSAKEGGKDLALISKNELTKVENSVFNAHQIQMLLKRTPRQYVQERPAKGGGKWKFVSGGYVKKALNIMFAWDWDFEILDKQILFNEVVVTGKLTCRSNGKTITKTQIGNKEIVFKKGTKDPLSIGNDFKAAATDALKKCAAEIGIAADVYNANEFREVSIDVSEDPTPAEIQRQKEIDRLKKLINNAKSLEELEKLGVHVEKMADESINEVYNSRLSEYENSNV